MGEQEKRRKGLVMTDKKRYQIIHLHLSDGRTILATVPEFCKEGDDLYLLPKIEVTAPKELADDCHWTTTDKLGKE